MFWRSPRGRLLLLSPVLILSLWTFFRLVVQPPPSGSSMLNHILTWRPAPSSSNLTSTAPTRIDQADGQATAGAADSAAEGKAEGKETASVVKDESTKIIVVGKRLHEDTSWIEAELPDWQRAIYTIDDRSGTLPLATKVNRTSAALLQYIVTNYDSPTIPTFIASIPTQRYSPWSNEDAWDGDGAFQLANMQVSWCQGAAGYCNLRCASSRGCVWDAEGVRIGAAGAAAEGWSRFGKTDETDEGARIRHIYEEVWKGLFGQDKELPSEIAVNGGARFGFSKYQLARRKKEEYERMLTFVEQEERFADEELDGVMADLWHVVFGQDPVHCMDRKLCYRSVYGRLGFL